MKFDAIDLLAALGYTEREASFLYLTAVHSGYFLRRQFIHFVSGQTGSIATNFLRKAIHRRHVASLSCSEGRFIYHLCGKAVYRLLDRPDSQNRRIKSPPDILRRLISMDYILRRFRQETFVESREGLGQLLDKSKVEFSESSFLNTLISFREDGPNLTVRFAYVDEGQRSIARFERFVQTNGNGIRAIENAEVAYVATNSRNFKNAERIFQRHLPLRALTSPACPRGVQHFIDWLQIRHKFHGGRISITPAEHRVLLEGENLYRAPVHRGFIASLANGTADTEKIRRFFKADSRRVLFEVELIKSSYPNLLVSGIGHDLGGSRGNRPMQKSLFTNNLEEIEGTG